MDVRVIRRAARSCRKRFYLDLAERVPVAAAFHELMLPDPVIRVSTEVALATKCVPTIEGMKVIADMNLEGFALYCESVERGDKPIPA